jgi:hypothetical protein
LAHSAAAPGIGQRGKQLGRLRFKPFEARRPFSKRDSFGEIGRVRPWNRLKLKINRKPRYFAVTRGTRDFAARVEKQRIFCGSEGLFPAESSDILLFSRKSPA